jgi:hypothetical protein
MKKALILLLLEVVVLGIAVVAYVAGEGPGVRQPPVVATERPAPALARTEVPVSIVLSRPVGRVETAALARGGQAQKPGSRARVAGQVAVKKRTTRSAP